MTGNGHVSYDKDEYEASILGFIPAQTGAECEASDLTNSVSSFNGCWGGDKLGKEFAEKYEPVRDAAFTAARNIGVGEKGLGSWVDSFLQAKRALDNADNNNADAIKAVIPGDSVAEKRQEASSLAPRVSQAQQDGKRTWRQSHPEVPPKR